MLRPISLFDLCIFFNALFPLCFGKQTLATLQEKSACRLVVLNTAYTFLYKTKAPSESLRWVQAHLKKLQIDRRISQPLLCQALQQRQTLIEALGCQCDLAGRGVILHQLPAHLVLG